MSVVLCDVLTMLRVCECCVFVQFDVHVYLSVIDFVCNLFLDMLLCRQ